jgi:DNA gyrase subunit A
MENNHMPVTELLAEEEVKKSYLTYAMSVIVSRALPDARDGLKPSQRRILVAMNDLNLGPRGKHRKCAKIAGDTSGNYHPHGESVIYPTLVRMAQDFSIRYPLIDGQGNFGSIDGDPPAAMRYTEARMTPVALEMMADIKRQTVDFISNYEETREEPTVLPGKFPNLLCNGSSGIAVGMATSLPPHNVGEICRGLIHLLKHPDCQIHDLMQFVKGPDFPTGAIIRGRSGILQGYSKGRGRVILEARVCVEETNKGNDCLVVTEIPYQVNKTNIVEKIANLVKEGVIDGIRDIRDESSRQGMRLVIECKKGEDSNVILNQLYKHTQLRTSFSIINIVIVNQRPKTLDLKGLMACYRDHRIEVVRRRTRYLLSKAEERAHIVEGLRIALTHIDEVVALIRGSRTPEEASEGLKMRFSLSQKQTSAILEMRLQRLTGLEIEKLEEEYRKLIREIEDYRSILENEDRVIEMLIEDLEEIMKKHSNPRLTEIDESEVEDISMEDLIAEETVAITISQAGYVKRLPLDTYRSQKRGGRGVSGMKVKEGDEVTQLLVCSTHSWMLFFTSRGKVHWRKAYQIPEASRTAMGRALVNLLNLEEDETVTSCVPVDDFEENVNLVMGTAKGMIKKSALQDFKNVRKGGIIAIGLKEGDSLVGVIRTSGKDSILLATHQGQIIHFQEEKVRVMGRGARGVGGINLQKNDRVISVLKGSPEGHVLTVCHNGYGKRTPVEAYRLTGRNGKGIINIKTAGRNGPVIACLNVGDRDDILMMTSSGMVVRTSVSSISLQGRNTQGVSLIRLKNNDSLVSVARIDEGSLEVSSQDESED